jgi:membrane-associated phospholipid phosphatase
MKRQLLTLIVLGLMAVVNANAENYTELTPLKLETPEMKPELVALPANPFAGEIAMHETGNSNMGLDLDFFKSKTAPGVKPYKFMDDMTFVGVPLFLAGWAIKGQKAMFRVNNKDGKANTQLLTDFKTGIDDYTQFFGPVMTVGLKLSGYEGRSDWPRLLASAAMSYGIMAALVNGIKYTAKEMRPDGSTANSWPSGHTATAFVGATLLHKEYGLTRSPWFSVAGYGVATATGVMRVLNNRHWVSDVMSGAGIGILSGELGYALSDVLFKGKGLLHNDLIMDFENPSFFSIGMGVGMGGKDIEFTRDDLVDKEFYSDKFVSMVEEEPIEFRAATVVDAEGAYFFNKYIGVGGRFRVRAMSAKSFGKFVDIASMDASWAWEDVAYNVYYPVYGDDFDFEAYERLLWIDGNPPIQDMGGIVRSDHMAEFTGSVGLYFNLPLSKRFALGAKALIGRSITQELEIDGYAKGYEKKINHSFTVINGEWRNATLEMPSDTGETYDQEWEYLTLGADNSTSWGTGISLTYKYKSNFSWKLYIDYDYSEKNFKLKYHPYGFLKYGMNDYTFDMISISDMAYSIYPSEYQKKKKMNYFTLGLSFLVNL